MATADTSPHVQGDAVDVGPSDATDWLSEHGAGYGLCQIYANEPWHYELRPDAVDGGCPAPVRRPDARPEDAAVIRRSPVQATTRNGKPLRHDDHHSAGRPGNPTVGPKPGETSLVVLFVGLPRPARLDRAVEARASRGSARRAIASIKLVPFVPTATPVPAHPSRSSRTSRSSSPSASTSASSRRRGGGGRPRARSPGRAWSWRSPSTSWRSAAPTSPTSSSTPPEVWPGSACSPWHAAGSGRGPPRS